MEIRALKNFIYGGCTAKKGDVVTMTKAGAGKLIRIGLAEAVENASDANAEGANPTENDTDGETAAPTEKSTKSAKTGAKK